MIRYSKFNIISRIRDSEKYFIVNQLSGNADILTADEAGLIQSFKGSAQAMAEENLLSELISKGYLAEPESEEQLYRRLYLDFIDNRDTDEIQLFFITNYSCNFACSYCYQDQYKNPADELRKEVIDAFFTYIRKEFPGRKKYITVFGGEPLLPGTKQMKLIEYLIESSNKESLDLCFVTNGYSLPTYTNILRRGRIREIQVTLDGTADVHNKRRYLKGGAGTFDKVVQGIDSCLENAFPVNLRMVIDKDNIENLPGLARFAIDKGWTKNPLFKTQIGRNYELHHCQSAPDKLFSRISLYEYISRLVKEHPYILEFYKPAYSITKFLAENGTLPEPLFDSCPACKTEWALDYTGKIYPCTATVGKSDECLGTFFPDIVLKRELAEEWQNRDITSIKECRDCNLMLSCGGGCGSVAKNKNGALCSPDCRPVKELLELGFSAYFQEK